MRYIYNNLQSIIIICTYDLWVPNQSINQSKPPLQVTKTRDSMFNNTKETFNIEWRIYLLGYNAM
jgi:hypothetical protein